MFFTKKCNYFSRATRWNHPFLSQPPLKGCFGTLKLTDGFYWHWLYLNNNWPRGDYKELVELLIIYLGGKIYNFKFRITGADHHAIWMSKIIYCLKISLLINQYKLDDESKAKLLECAKFQSIIYCKYWFMTPFAAAAPLLDLEFYGKLLKWRTVSPTQAFYLMKLARKHHWYITPKLVTLSLFDQGFQHR